MVCFEKLRGGMHVFILSADFYYNFKSVVQNSNRFRLLFPSIRFMNLGSKKCLNDVEERIAKCWNE